MALQVSLTIPPNEIKAVPTIPEGATEAEAAIIQDEINKATAHNMGDIYPQAYARVMIVRSMAEQSFIWVLWYANAEARQNDGQPVKSYEYPVDTDNLPGNIYPAAYTYLKSLPEFAGAVDC